MTQIKNARLFTVPEGETFVTDGTLVLIPTNVEMKNPRWVNIEGENFIPYIISDEAYSIGDDVLHLEHGLKMKTPGLIKGPGWNKVIVLPEIMPDWIYRTLNVGLKGDGVKVVVEVNKIELESLPPVIKYEINIKDGMAVVHRPEPYKFTEPPFIGAGDPRVLINGKTLLTDARIISEDGYQHLLTCKKKLEELYKGE